MNITHYTTEEGGAWLPWTAGSVDGRALRKRGKDAVSINEVSVHSLKFEDGKEWDCVNGMRPEIEAPSAEEMVRAEFSDAVDRLIGLADKPPEGEFARRQAQAYANRVWAGQSPSLSRHERLGRVAVALEAQGLSMEGVVL